MTQTWLLLKSPPQSNPGCFNARVKLPVGMLSENLQFTYRIWSLGCCQHKTSIGTGLSVTFALASPWHCQPCPHPSPASLSLCWFPICNPNLSNSFLWLAFMWACIHLLGKYLPTCRRPWLKLCSYQGKVKTLCFY